VQPLGRVKELLELRRAFDRVHDVYFDLLQLRLHPFKQLRDLEADILRDSLRLDLAQQELKLLELVVIGLESVVDISRFRRDEL